MNPRFLPHLLGGALLTAAFGCAGAPLAAPVPEPPPRSASPPARPEEPRPDPEQAPQPDPERLQDSIYVAGAQDHLPCQVLRLETGTLEISIDRERLTLVAKGERPGALFPDAVLARQLRVVLRCRILAESPQQVTLALPWDQVERLDRSSRRSAPVDSEERPGSLAGIVSVRGKPLARARLRAVRLTGRSLIPGVLEAPPTLESALEAVTGEDGRFFLEGVPPGSYKIWVQPPGEEAWLRRASMVPDVHVPPGERAVLEDFDIRTIGGA